MRARGQLTINDAATGSALSDMRESTTDSIPGDPDRERSSHDNHHLRVMETRPLKMLLLGDDPEATERIISAVCMTPTDVHCVSSIAAGLTLLDSNHFDVIAIDRHVGGWVSAQSCRDLVARAGGRPAVGLINADCVIDFQDAIEARLTGVYYKDEMNVHLMRRLGRLAYLPSVDVS